MKLAILVMAASLARAVFAAGLLEPPQTLKDAQGKPETGFVDPFAQPSERATGGRLSTPGEGEGFMRTSLGEISTDFRILAIVVPADTNLAPTAVLQLNGRSEPVTVHPGESVRIENREEESPRGRRGRAVTAKAAAGGIKDKLKDYMFYLYIKSITPTHLEVYHNKKRPDETIILNW